jgi:hypothetical protein
VLDLAQARAALRVAKIGGHVRLAAASIDGGRNDRDRDSELLEQGHLRQVDLDRLRRLQDEPGVRARPVAPHVGLEGEIGIAPDGAR